MPLDHFDYTMEGSVNTFPVRYYWSTEHVNASDPDTPILLYTGNEGPIDGFWNITGFVTKNLSKEFKAAVLFIEHRYYGTSIPFNGNTTEAFGTNGT